MTTNYSGSRTEERALDAFIKLQRAAESVRKRCRTFQDAGLTGSQFGVLDVIYHLGPLHQNEIGRKILKTDANTTTVIDNLEDRQLVERTRDPEDRRCYQIRLTETGRSLFESIFPEHVERVVEVFDGLNVDEQETLARLCRKLGMHESDHSNSS